MIDEYMANKYFKQIFDSNILNNFKPTSRRVDIDGDHMVNEYL